MARCAKRHSLSRYRRIGHTVKQAETSRGTSTRVFRVAPVFRPGDLFSRRLFGWFAFEFRHFRQTATKVRRAAESRGEKCLHQFPGEGVTDHEAAKQIRFRSSS